MRIATMGFLVAAALLSAAAAAGPLDSVAAGTWYQFSSSRLDAVGPTNLPDGYLNAVIIAWSGGAYDSDRDQLIVWGGGHTDYAGNEVYSFGPLNGATPAWKRLTNPSSPAANNTNYASDGRPVARHTYNLLTYLPAPRNQMMSCAIGSMYSNGNSGNAVDFYDFTVDGMSGQPWSKGALPPAPDYGIGGICVEHQTTGQVWFHGSTSDGAALQKYDPATNAWTKYASLYLEPAQTGAIDPDHNLLITTGGGHGIRMWDLNNPSADSVVVTSAGVKDIESATYPGLVYDTVNHHFVGWSGGSTVYTLTPPSNPKTGTWQWATIALASGNSVTPTAPAGVRNSGYVIGTFGRFRYVPSSQGVVVVNSTDENVFFFKLPNTGGAAPPSITLSASPTSVAAQGTSVLTWSVTGATSCTASGGWTGTKATSGSETTTALTATQTYTLTCGGTGGQTSRAATVTVTDPAASPTVTFAASPTSIASGGSSTLTWSTTNATSCTAGNGWAGTKGTSGSIAVGPLSQTTTYTLSCTGTGGSASGSATVTVTPPAPVAPTVSVNASPTSVVSGGTSTLSWNATNATACTASGGWSGTVISQGSLSVGPLTVATTYSVSCSGAGGTASDSVTVSVTSATTAVVHLSATPTAVDAGQFATLTWDATNATSCTASGDWSGDKPVNGSASMGPLTNQQTYDLTCMGSGGTASASAKASVAVMTPTDATGGTKGGGGSFDGLTLGALGGLVLLSWLRTRAAARRLVPIAALAALAFGAPVVAKAGNIEDVTIVGKSASAQTNVPVTFGLVLKPGDAPSGTVLKATLADGTALSLQVDAKATHADGSMRHSVVSTVLPSLSGNGSQIVRIATGGTAPAGTAVKLADLLATNFDARVDLNVGGTTYSASAKTLLQSTTPIAWLSGPVVSEWVVGAPVKTSGGTAHPHLTAYFHVRAYAGTPISKVHVDVVIENGWLMVAGPTTQNYTATISVGGSTVATQTVGHYHHARWHQQFWWGTGPQSYTKFNTQYLQSTGAVPQYPNLTPTDSYLNSLPTTFVPMSNGPLTQNMPDTGAHDDIGPFPRWTSAYFLNADERAYRATLLGDDSAGSFSIHYRDEATGKPVSIADHPDLTNQFNQLPTESGSNPNIVDVAHQPSMAFVSYLVTGDYYYLEELQFWASYIHLQANPLPPYGYRQGAQGLLAGQVRAQAWGLRNIGQAGYATPDVDRYKAELVSSIGYNLAFNEGLYPDNPSGNKLGALASFDGYLLFAPWMDDFYTWTMGYLVDLGYPAQKMRAYKGQFPVGRMGTTPYCYVHGAAYHLTTGTSDTDWFADFNALYVANFGANTGCAEGQLMTGYPDSPSGYPSNLRPALAVAVDAGLTGAVDAWNRLLRTQAIAPSPGYADYPVWAVVPRTTTLAAPSVTLSASPTSVSAGQTTTLTWTSSGADSCVASGGWAGTVGTSGTQVSAAINSSTTFTLTCTGSGQSTAQSITVTIAAAASPPTVTLSASPTSVVVGGSSTLTWSTSNATACTASGGWSGTVATHGASSQGPINAVTTYTLTCTGAGGSDAQSATVTTTATPPPAPTVTLSASPSTVAAGASSTLTWSSTNATSCMASGAWSGTKSTSGSTTVMISAPPATLTLDCTGSGGSDSQSVTIALTPAGGDSGSKSGGGAFDGTALLGLGLIAGLRARRARRRRQAT